MAEKNMMQKATDKQKSIGALITSDQMKKQWAMVLPACLTPDRLARVALSQLRRTPKLASCTQESLLNSLMGCAEMGLEPNGRHAHLIPYGQECTLIVDYKGLVELAMRSGKVSRIHADVVCENDSISIKNGEITHEINPLKERGDMVGAYAMCFFKDGTAKHEYMSKSEVDSVRNRSKAGKSGPWVTDYNEMAKKTVFRRMSKWLPLSPEMQDKIIQRDADVLEPLDADAIDVGGPVYEDSDLKKEAGKKDEASEPENAEPPKEEEPPAPPKTEVLAAVEDMSKKDLIAEGQGYEGRDFYDEVVAKHMPPECELSTAPVSMLREIVKGLREQADAEQQ